MHDYCLTAKGSICVSHFCAQVGALTYLKIGAPTPLGNLGYATLAEHL